MDNVLFIEDLNLMIQLMYLPHHALNVKFQLNGLVIVAQLQLLQVLENNYDYHSKIYFIKYFIKKDNL
jgi:hypothetical protein